MTDMIYGIPLLPFALVLAALFGMGYLESIFVIGIILWRGSARVIRSQVLQIRERPFILSAKATGASNPYIIIRHILPNVAPMAVLFFALTTGATIILIAGLSFLGAANPYIPSWGVMVRNAFNSGTVGTKPWWALPPGLGISITVLSLYMFGRGYEKVASADEAGDQAIAQTG
jgi:peptide/nickel transport system permease protein